MTFVADPTEEQKLVWKDEQIALQKRIILVNQISFDPDTLEGLKWVGGVDLSFPDNDDERAVACLVVMSYPALKVVHRSFLETRLTLPYIAGFLAFREVQPLRTLLDNLKRDHPEIYPQVVLVDGNGRLHPRTCGVACHLGVLTDTPTIGVAKNFLVIKGELDMKEVKAICRNVLNKAGDNLVLQGPSGIVYGAAQRTTDGAPNPVFVSQGHRISLETSLKVALATSQYRIPEPIRRADLDSRTYIRKNGKVPDSDQSKAPAPKPSQAPTPEQTAAPAQIPSQTPDIADNKA